MNDDPMVSIYQAAANFEKFKKNPYPGRIIIIGLNESATHFIQVYAVMGRSENSRNRIFVANDGELRTEAADPTKVKDPSLIIYKAMAEHGHNYVVSNGDQTVDIINSIAKGGSFSSGLLTRKYEPDEPNFTPRISGICILGEECSCHMEMSVLRKSDFSKGCDRSLYRFDKFFPGLGYCLTTYLGDGNPLPSFRGDPYLLPLSGNIAESIWGALNEENRVCLAVKSIDISSGQSRIEIINKYSKV